MTAHLLKFRTIWCFPSETRVDIALHYRNCQDIEQYWTWTSDNHTQNFPWITFCHAQYHFFVRSLGHMILSSVYARCLCQHVYGLCGATLCRVFLLDSPAQSLNRIFAVAFLTCDIWLSRHLQKMDRLELFLYLFKDIRDSVYQNMQCEDSLYVSPHDDIPTWAALFFRWVCTVWDPRMDQAGMLKPAVSSIQFLSNHQ